MVKCINDIPQWNVPMLKGLNVFGVWYILPVFKASMRSTNYIHTVSAHGLICFVSLQGP